VAILSSALRLARLKQGNPITIEEMTSIANVTRFITGLRNP
jgi:hypothetical protein